MSVYNASGVELSTAYAANGASLADVYNAAGERIGMNDLPPEFLDTAVLAGLSSVSVSGTKQGACTDGEYIYQTAGDSANYTYMRIIKYRISDGTYSYVQFDGTPNFGHANDMCYNPNNGYLYVCTMLSDGSVIVLDSSDLSYVDTIYLENVSGNPYAVWQFCFDRDTNHFLSINGNNLISYDQSWNFVSYITIPEHIDATAQGCETDGTYFYRITYNPNKIDIIKLSDGTRVKTMTNPMSGEPETMMYDWNGHYFINKNASSGVIFYRAQLFE